MLESESIATATTTRSIIIRRVATSANPLRSFMILEGWLLMGIGAWLLIK
jgi:hypothetical protein